MTTCFLFENIRSFTRVSTAVASDLPDTNGSVVVVLTLTYRYNTTQFVVAETGSNNSGVGEILGKLKTTKEVHMITEANLHLRREQNVKSTHVRIIYMRYAVQVAAQIPRKPSTTQKK